MVVLHGKLLDRQRATRINFDPVPRPYAGSCTLHCHVVDSDTGSRQIQPEIGIVLDHVPAERSIGSVDVDTVVGRILNSVPAEPTYAELLAHDPRAPAINCQVLDLNLGSPNHENRAPIQTLDDSIVAADRNSYDTQAGKVIDCDRVMAGADHPDDIAVLGIESLKSFANRV